MKDLLKERLIITKTFYLLPSERRLLGHQLNMLHTLLELAFLIQLALASFLPQQSVVQFPINGADHNASHFCYEWLKLSPNITALPSSPLYRFQQETYFTSQQAHLFPSCRFSPSTESELQNVFLSIVSHHIPFAIRSGGHSWNTGFSNTNNGITIDLVSLNKIQLSADGNSVLLGPGARWIAVYQYLESRGLSAPGGRDADVGVGGYVLGGGLNWFSNRLGFAVDALVSARVMLATGKIVEVSSEKNPELFWALKGSGGLLGVVTEFEMRVLKQSEFYGGFLFYEGKHADHLIDALVETTVNAERDLDSVAYIGAGYVGRTNQIPLSAVLANLGGRSSSEALRRFERIPSLEGGFPMGIKNISSIARDMHAANPIGMRGTKSTFTVAADALTLKRIHKVFSDETRDIKIDSAMGLVAIGFQALTKSHLSFFDNVLGFERLEKEAMICMYSLQPFHQTPQPFPNRISALT